jgi:ribonuclease Z
MSRFSKFVLSLVALLVIAAALAWWQRGPLSLWAMSRMVTQVTANADPIALMNDGLHVGLCGAGSPFPDDRRSGPCTVVVAGRQMFVFDAGSGAARNITRMRLNNGQIEAIFLTHYHSDHIDGLGELLMQRWGTGNASTPVPIYGPQGLDQVVQGFQQAYAPDRGYRIAHHNEQVMVPAGFGASPMMFDLPADTGRAVLIATPDLEIVAFRVNHAPVEPAVGYRIRYKDRVVVISGDTTPSPAVEREAKGADLLIHEALSPKLLRVLEDGFRKANRGNLAKIMHESSILHHHSQLIPSANRTKTDKIRAARRRKEQDRYVREGKQKRNDLRFRVQREGGEQEEEDDYEDVSDLDQDEISRLNH